MTAYMIARVNVTNPEQYEEYKKLSPGAIAKYDGRFLVRGGDMATLEGPECSERVILVEFPSMERAKEFYNSEDYQHAISVREGAAEAQFILIDGLE